MSRRRTAVLADAQPMFRAGLADALGRAGVEVVAEAANRHEAVAAAVRHRPGVCVLDLDLAGGALAATKRITVAVPETIVVVLGSTDDGESLVAAVRAGAKGYLPRSTSAPGLARAIADVLEGSAAIPRAGVAALIRELRAAGRRRAAIGGSEVSLTEREATAVQLLREGLGTREIAEELGLSPVTVRRYLSTVARKTGAPSREALLRTLRAT